MFCLSFLFVFVFFFSYEEESSGSLETPRFAISIIVSLLKGRSCLGTAFGKNFSMEEFGSVGTWAVSSIPGTPVP